MHRLLIEVSGGVVNAIWADEEDLDILLLDHDVDGADKEELECYEALQEVADAWQTQLIQVY